MAMTMRIGRCRLKSILRKKQMTQTELSNMLQITPQRVSDYANDRVTMSLQMAANVSRVLEVPIMSLYQWID
jgi:DNA-binding XRE family transcriptional regulator